MQQQPDDPLTRRYAFVQLKPSNNLTDEQQIRMEQSIRANPNLRGVSVLPEPEFLTEQEIRERQAETQNRIMAERQKLPIAQLDLTREDREQAIRELLEDRFSKNHGLTPEMQVLIAALRGSVDYAWTWASNVAVSCMDEGVDWATANRAAARFMFTLAGVDLSQAPHYQQTQALPDYEYEDVVRVARERNEVYKAYLEFYGSVATRDGVAPIPSGFPMIDREQVEWPIAFRFGASKTPGRRIVLTIVAAGEKVQQVLTQSEQAADGVTPVAPVETVEA